MISPFGQALVLLCFNGSDVLSYEKLQELTQIPPAELQLTLQSLSLHRTVKLLLMHDGTGWHWHGTGVQVT